MSRRASNTTSALQIATANPYSNASGAFGFWVQQISSSSTGYIFAVDSSTQFSSLIDFYANTDGSVAITTKRASGGSSNTAKSSTTPLTDGKWHYILWVSSGTSWTLYVDGVSTSLTITGSNNGDWFADITFTGNIRASFLNVYTGSYTLGCTGCNIAYATFWNAVLNSSEAAALANGVHPLLLRNASIQGHWSLWKGCNADFAKGAHNGTIIDTLTDGSTDAPVRPLSSLFWGPGNGIEVTSSGSTVSGSVSESITGTDAVSATKTTSGTGSESITITDAASATESTSQTEAEAATLADSVSATKTTAGTGSESATLSDGASAGKVTSADVSESVTLSGSDSATKGPQATQAESGILDAVVDATLDAQAQQAEAATLGETADATVDTSATQAESVTLTDQTSAGKTTSATQAESVTLSETAAGSNLGAVAKSIRISQQSWSVTNPGVQSFRAAAAVQQRLVELSS